ncbi:membrane protein [Clostridioides difficile]|nr:membrane protein [Clostridioides difficile]
MDNLIRILILAVIGGFIGYVTNVVAIRLIFRPIEPIKIPILNIEIVGLIPKRRAEIAANVGEIIQEEFLSMDEILANIITDEDKEEVVRYIKARIKIIIHEKVSFIPSGIKSMIQDYLGEIIESEVKQSIDELSKNIINKANERIDIQKMVEDKINELDLYELEEIIIRIAKKELKHIEFLGLVLGFLIGIAQGLITMFI